MEIWLSLKGILLMLLFTWHTDSVFCWKVTGGPTPFDVETPSGNFSGTRVLFSYTKKPIGVEKILDEYLGIPYAKPPVGPLRFKKPEPVEPFNGTFVADKMPAACIQYSGLNFPWYDFEDGKSEDCLYLNIWVPSNRSEDLPVFFWIYGGGFTVGSIRNSTYDGSALAARDVVVVTINYRMGVFGFLTSGTEEAPGNYGMYDMLEALNWVKRNIAAFGGDPNQVTLVGESAGSIAIGLLCVSPLAKGLFHRVIMESGSPAYTLADNSKAVSIATSQRLAKTVGCANNSHVIDEFPRDVISCLREKEAMELAKTLNDFHPNSARSFFPHYGDEILPKNARQALIDGDFNNVSVLIGNNADEGAFQMTTAEPHIFGFFGEANPKIGIFYAKLLLKRMFGNFPDHGDSVIVHYLGDVRNDDYDRIGYQVYTAMGDYSLLCPTVFFAESYSRAGNDVHYYYFTHRPSKSPWAKWMGAVHFDEVNFVFGRPMQEHGYTDDEALLSDNMIRMWTNFVKTGSTCVSIDWPRYSRENPVYLKLNTDSMLNDFDRISLYGRGPNKCNCDFFRSYFGFQ